MTKISIFISYSHEDEDYKNKLEKHLSLLKRKNTIETWNDRKIIAGQEWDNLIKSELEHAHIILLLVSVDFLSSNYCYDIEIKRAIEKHENKEAIIIPIILRKCDWQETDFGKIQALPKNATPVKSYKDEDEAFFEIIEGIKKSILLLEKNERQKKDDLDDSDNTNLKITHLNKLGCDIPPNILHWVGRKIELNEIDQDHHKVVFLSGIGGQGKSGLASHYVQEVSLKENKWEFWDWRDCQEKENRIHTKIISIIERLTNGTVKAKELTGELIDDLIDLFFQVLSSRKIIFVFDNIDAYIEYETFQLTGTVQKLYKAALTRNHNSKFVFTCRTSINDVDPELLTIRLQGLSKEETILLFTDYTLPCNETELIGLADKSFNLTKGHPLWLNLIAAQARRGRGIAEKFIEDVMPNSNFQEENLSSILSTKILGTIWQSLNEKQKTLLMAFAEIVKAETFDNLGRILESELNFNQFLKAFKALKLLNLIVIKSSTATDKETFELHPLVKEYIVHNFRSNERSRYISLFMNFYNGIILVLKPKLNSEQPLSFFENWTAQIELAINKDDYKLALILLEDISTSICDAGYVEEYIRVCNLLYIQMDWKIAISEEWSYFNSQFSKFADTLTEFGKFDESNAFLIKYEKLILNKGANYIRFCQTKGHFYWFQGKYDQAIEITSTGLELIEGNVVDDFGIENTLALALRDSRSSTNINKALAIFLKDRTVEELKNESNNSFINGEAFGNVGRCLQFLDRGDEALFFFKISLRRLKSLMNKGYCYLWIGECLINLGETKNGLILYFQVLLIWKKVSPVKTIGLTKLINSILDNHPHLLYIQELSEKELEKLSEKITQ